MYTYGHTYTASGGVMVCSLDWQTYTSRFESYWVSHLNCLVPHRSVNLSKLKAPWMV